MTTIVQAMADEELADAQHLLETLDAWRRERQGSARLGHSGKCNPLHDAVSAAELVEAPGPFAPPQGRLLVAYEADQPAGAVALRNQGGETGEVTWMFVSPPFQRQRVGQALVERLLLEARAAGYERICCFVSPQEHEALALCERMGFERRESEPEPSDTSAEALVVFEQDLRLLD